MNTGLKDFRNYYFTPRGYLDFGFRNEWIVLWLCAWKCEYCLRDAKHCVSTATFN